MNFERFLILAGAIWCTVCTLICLLGGIVAFACAQPDACVDPGYEAAILWSKLLWTIPMFGAGAFIGFRAVWPYIRAPRISDRNK
ncbi:hypothetical protein [Ottowia sp.]|uniref:hypothetical protein n=1 Tax=Ottowia sp. TaxID=1898956 RepID=UPI0025F8C9D7|nr:hypothetical protein [Ottowia sp.]MBK6616687.1 hypothetical protein [Ottowia sp.]